MSCKDIREKYNFTIGTREMSEILTCVGLQYEEEIILLKKQVAELKKNISKTKDRLND